MAQLSDYFGSLVNRAFSDLRTGVERQGATSANALDLAATGLRPIPQINVPSSQQPLVPDQNMYPGQNNMLTQPNGDEITQLLQLIRLLLE